MTRRTRTEQTFERIAFVIMLTVPVASASAADFPFPVENRKAGISLSLSRRNGVDWAVEHTYHDASVGDQVIYLGADGSYWNPLLDQAVTWYECATDPTIDLSAGATLDARSRQTLLRMGVLLLTDRSGSIRRIW